MKSETEDNLLVAYPEENITSNNAAQFEQDLSGLLAGSPGMELVIDAGYITYMSSAGLRVLIKLSQDRDTPLTVRNVGSELYEIFDITGFTDILNVQRKMRSISIDGCEIIGKGAMGTVYKIDDDTIVKVYEPSVSLEIINKERERARQAFIKGIPTAISFDLVRVGGQYGAVFELLKAENLNDVVAGNPDKQDELIDTYVELIRKIHSIEAQPGQFPDAKEVFAGYLDKLNDVLPSDISDRVRGLLVSMPECNTITHGDIQMKNVMMTENEPMFIDMETLSIGSPIFDLQGLYVTYIAFPEDEPDNTMKFIGISRERCERIWQRILTDYFEGLSEEQIRQKEDKIRVVAYIRFLNIIATLGITVPELLQVRIDHTIGHLRELLDRVDTLEL